MTQSPPPSSEPRRGVPLWAQILIWSILLGLLLVIGIGLARVERPMLAIGREVPDFTLPLYTGYEYQGRSEVRLSELRGQVVVINFWASWCKPCESEAADLEAAWRHYQPGGEVVFLGVDYVDTPLDGLSYLVKFDITYPNGPDQGSRISAIFNREMGVPETYIIDQQGILRFIKIGPFTSLAEIQAVLDPLLRR